VTVVDEYVAGLSGALRGPRRVKSDLVAEARDSLVDATEALQRQGLPEDRAQERAVAEFGSLAAVVPDYQAELAVAQGRRTALLFAGGLVVLRYLAPLMWVGSPWAHDASQATVYTLLASGFDFLAVAGAVAALGAFLALGWGSRFVPDGPRVTRLVGCAALGFLALHGLAGAAVYLWSLVQWPGFVYWPPVWVGLLLANGAFAWAVVCAWRCVAVSGRTRRAALAS
jgi:hypothetical protein